MYLHIKNKQQYILYVFTYNLLYLFKIDVKAYNHDDISEFC